MTTVSPPLIILNVDDHEINRYTRSRVLRQAGFEVKEASTGGQALQIIQQEHPPLVLLDVNLPDIDGLEVCRRIKNDPALASTLVLQISASLTSSTDKVRGLEGGADAYLVEPVEPTELVATVKALLRLQQAEEALRDSETRFRLALVNAPVSVAIQDRDLRFVWAYNQRTVRPADIIGKTDADLFPPEDAAHLIALKRQVLESGVEVREQLWLTSSGHRVFLDLFLEPTRDETEQVTGVGVATVDLTAMKQAEEASQVALEKYRVLFESFPLGITITDKTGQIVEANKEAERLLGVSTTKHTQRRIDGLEWQIIRPDGKPMSAEEYASVRALQKNRLVENVEMGIVKEGDEITWINVTAAPIPLEDYGVAVVYGDITEHKRAEEEIQSLARFPGENPYPVLRISKDGVILYANRSSQEWLESWNVQVGSRVPDVWLETITRLLETGKSEEREISIGAKIFAVIGTPFSEPGYVNLYGRDITEHKRAEESLHESEERYRSLFNGMTEGFALHEIICDEQGRPCDYRFLDLNPSFEKLTGLKRQEVVGKLVSEVLPNNEPYWVEIYGAVALTGEPVHFDNYSSALDRDYEVYAYCPAPGQFAVLFIDVSERKRAEAEREHLLAQVEQERQRAEELAQTLAVERDILQIIMENTRAHLAYLDPQFNFVRVNSTYASGSGHTLEELIGRNHFDLFPNPENQAIFEQVRDTGRPFAFLAKPFEFADQPERGVTYWDWTLAPVKDSGGQVQGLVLSLLDVTERIQAEERLHQALDESQQRQTEIAALLAGSQAILRYREFYPAAQLIFDACKQLLGATSGYVALLSEDGTENEVIFLDPGEQTCTVDPALPMPIRGLRAKVIQTNKFVYDNDFSQSKWLKYLPEGHARIDNVLFVPLELDRQVVGLLGLANKPGGFTENDTRMAAAFGELAAIALFNSRTLESLENSETRFRSVAQTASEAIITIDSQGKIVFWNRAATTILGYPVDEAIGQSLALIIPERFRAAHRQGLERLVSGGESHIIGKTVELIGLRKDGAEFPLELSLSTWKVREEVFFTGMIHDITERKGAEMALRQAHHELEQRVQERTAELAQINQTLEQRVEERTHELATLLEASHNLASTLEMERLLGLILDQLKRVVDYSEVTIYKAEGESLIALAHRGPVPKEEILKLRFSLRQAPVYQYVIFQQTSVIIPDVRGNTSLARSFRESVGEHLTTTFGYVRSWLGVPLTSKEQVIGMVGVHHSQPDHYTTHHAELALTFANQAALAIENARLYEQAQELAAFQERQRLARDLHDSVSQSLFSASLSAEVLPRLWERHPEEGRRCLAELHRLTRGALAEMRTLLLELRPMALVETALGDLLSQLTEALAGRARLPVTLAIEPHPPLPPEVQVALYRIAQEALNNVVKHAGASRVEVSLRPTSSLVRAEESTSGIELRISDDGRGFEVDHVSPVCLGLNIMRERAETIGATLKIESRTDQGTQMVTVWPGVKG